MPQHDPETPPQSHTPDIAHKNPKHRSDEIGPNRDKTQSVVDELTHVTEEPVEEDDTDE